MEAIVSVAKIVDAAAKSVGIELTREERFNNIVSFYSNYLAVKAAHMHTHEPMHPFDLVTLEDS